MLGGRVVKRSGPALWARDYVATDPLPSTPTRQSGRTTDDTLGFPDPTRRWARSVAVAALGAKRWSEVTKEDHAAVMRLWVRRRKDLAGSRTKVANQLQAVILELLPGGFRGEIYAAKVARLFQGIEPAGAAAAAAKSWPKSSWATCAASTARWRSCASA